MTSSPSPTPNIPQDGRRHLVLLLLAALTAHVPALRAGFVLDDRSLLIDNPYVRTLSGLGVLLRHELFVASGQPRIVPYYRPLSGLLNWVSYQALGPSALGQHALNLLLHGLVTALLYATLRTHRLRERLAFGISLIFAVHPASSEVVAYLGGRQDLIGWVLGLSTFTLMGHSGSLLAAALWGFGATLLGGLCHEIFLGLGVPLALMHGTSERKSAPARGAAALGGGVAAVLAIMLLRRQLGLVDYEISGLSLTGSIRATSGVALRLFKDLLLPTDLAVDVTVVLPPLLLALAGILAGAVIVLGLAIIVRRREPSMLGLLLAGWSIVALSAVLHSGVALKFGNISDRYAYATAVGMVFVAAATLQALGSSADPSSRLMMLTQRWGAIALAGTMVPLTWSRDASWRDEVSLQLAMIADRPDDPETHLAAGMMYFARDDLEAAYPHCQAYRAARPESEKANLCLGAWLLLHRRPAEAVTYLRPYALARPGMEISRRLYLGALLANRDFAEANATIADWSRTFVGASDLAEAKAALDALQRSTAPSATPPAASSGRDRE